MTPSAKNMIRLPSDVAAVVVTYGDRQCFLERVVRSLLSQGVARVIVVDNGAKWDVRSIASDAVHVFRTGKNLGYSALSGSLRHSSKKFDRRIETISRLTSDNKHPGSILPQISMCVDNPFLHGISDP